MFETTASGIIRELYERTHNRGRKPAGAHVTVD
jgi:hypothetical protein